MRARDQGLAQCAAMCVLLPTYTRLCCFRIAGNAAQCQSAVGDTNPEQYTLCCARPLGPVPCTHGCVCTCVSVLLFTPGAVPHDKPDTSKVHADQTTRFDGNKVGSWRLLISFWVQLDGINAVSLVVGSTAPVQLWHPPMQQLLRCSDADEHTTKMTAPGYRLRSAGKRNGSTALRQPNFCSCFSWDPPLLRDN